MLASDDVMNNPPPELHGKPRSALNTHLWLILSLVANFFLVIFLYIAMEPLGVPPPAAVSVQNDGTVKTNVVIRRENFTWSEVESTNYDIFIKNLRAIGCPEQTIRDIIVTDLDRLYARRRLQTPCTRWWTTACSATRPGRDTSRCGTR